MPMLKLQDGKNTFLINAWTAASANKGKETEICFMWALGKIGFFASSTGVDRLTYNIPFDSFMAYAADCEKKSRVIDLTDNTAMAPFLR